MSCFNPSIITNCERECKSDKKGFFTSPDDEIFDYDFSSLGKGGHLEGSGFVSNSEVNTIKGFNKYSYNNKTGITRNDKGDDVKISNTVEHTDLCHYKKALKLDAEKKKSTGFSIISGGKGELIVWTVVILIMAITWNTYENKLPFVNKFFSNDISSSLITGKGIGVIYVALCFVIMVVIRNITQTRSIEEINYHSIKSYLEDFLPYSIICLGAYVFFSGFLRMKGSETEISGGGISDNIKNISINTITIYIGVILMVINSFGISYFYLKQKARFRKDPYARSLYWSQITVMLMGCLTALFVFIFSFDSFRSMGKGMMLWTGIRWVLLILISIFLIHKINRITRTPHYWLQDIDKLKRKEDWFGNATTAEKAYVFGGREDKTAIKAYARDNEYNIPSEGVNSDKIKEWKIKSYENVYGKCYNRNPDDSLQCGKDSANPVGNCYKIGNRCTDLMEGGELCNGITEENACDNNDACTWSDGARCTGTGAEGAECQLVNDNCNGGGSCTKVEGICEAK